METVPLKGDDGSVRECVAMATTPDSPSSGYWSTNDDDLSNDVITASLGFDPSVGYGSCWLSSPYRGDLGNEMDDSEVGMTFGTDSWKSERFGADVEFKPEAEVDLGPEIVLQPEMSLEPELALEEPKLSADFKKELTRDMGPGSIPEVESELEPEMSLATGSSLLADFLFCDWIQGSRPADRMFDSLISGDVFPEYAFDGPELALGHPAGRWKEDSAARAATESQRRTIAKDKDETRLDEQQIFAKEDLTFEFDPAHPLETFSPDNRSISPLFPIDRISLDCIESPEADRTYSSGCQSPLDVASASTTSNLDLRSSHLDSEELFDVLLCEVLRQEPEADARSEVVKPELVLVATPSASKRKLSDDDGDLRSSKSSKLGSRICSVGIREGARRIELPVKMVAASSNVLQVPSAYGHHSSDRPRNVGYFPDRGKSQDGLKSRTSEEYVIPDLEISHSRPEIPKTGSEPVLESERLRTKSDQAYAKETAGDTCAKGIVGDECAKGNAGDACAKGNAGDTSAVGRAEVLAAMLQAEVVLREPNRGSDVIYAELRNGSVGESRSPPSVVPSSPRSSQRGATSLRSFLIRKQRDSSSSRQNLLHRLLKGETSEAEVRREQAASRQMTSKTAAADQS